MTQTVVAFFDDAATAKAAVSALHQAGFSDDAVDLASNSGSRTGDAFKRFFDHLFSDNDESTRYTNAAPTSGAVVTVHSEEEESALMAADLLNKSGARQVDDPNVTYESSSSLVGYQDAEENSVKNEYSPEEYSAAPRYGGEGGGESTKSPEQIMREADARARVLRAQVDRTLRLRD